MRVDIDVLKKKMEESGKTGETLAKEIGVDYTTFWRKMRGDGTAFSIGQMHAIAQALSLTKGEAASIFLAENLQ